MERSMWSVTGTVVPAVSLLACAVMAWQGRVGNTEVREALVTRELVIVHEDGSIGARIGVSPDGGSFLRLYGRDGVERASLEVDRWEESGKEDGERVRLVLRDDRARRSIELSHSDDSPHGDTKGLAFSWGDKPPFVWIGSGGSAHGNLGLLHFNDGNGVGLVELGAGRLGAEPRFELRRPERKEGDKRGVRAPGMFRVDLWHEILSFGGSERSLLYDSGKSTGLSSLSLRDERGTPLFEREQR